MADTKDTIKQPDQQNQTMQHEKAKAEVSGQSPDEKARLDKERQEKSAIGGGQQPQTGEPGRARNELDQDKSPTGQQR